MPMLVETEMARINRLIVMGGYSGMTELQFFAAEIDEWKRSQKRKEQITGDAYYEGFHDILQRKRTIIGEDGKLQEVDNLPNNKLVDNQFALMVDQKTNYLVGKPFTVTCKNKAYADLLTKVFNKRFNRLLKYVCEDALKGGIGWLFPYYGDNGQLAFKHFPAQEILPFWADDDHTILDCAIRLYPQEVWNGFTKEIVERVEIFKHDGIWRYVYDGTTLTPDEQLGEHENYFSIDEVTYNSILSDNILHTHTIHKNGLGSWESLWLQPCASHRSGSPQSSWGCTEPASALVQNLSRPLASGHGIGKGFRCFSA